MAQLLKEFSIHNHLDNEVQDHDLGLVHDLETMKRRGLLGLLIKAGMTIGLVGCGSQSADGSIGSGSLSSGSTNGSGSGGTRTDTSASEVPSTACATIPEETAGPYPGDGSNGPNALTASGIVRSDIRPSFNGLSGSAQGIPLTINLTLTDSTNNCAPLAGFAIYLWHCDRDGKYSLYDITNQNYLRGVQQTDSTGKVTFTSIFPACYSGRWPHIHFEVFRSLASATTSANKIRTSQIALTTNACLQVYATSGYSTSLTRFNQTSLTTDNVFSDGYSLQIPELTGDVTNGFALNLDIGVVP